MKCLISWLVEHSSSTLRYLDVAAYDPSSHLAPTLNNSLPIFLATPLPCLEVLCTRHIPAATVRQMVMAQPTIKTLYLSISDTCLGDNATEDDFTKLAADLLWLEQNVKVHTFWPSDLKLQTEIWKPSPSARMQDDRRSDLYRNWISKFQRRRVTPGNASMKEPTDTPWFCSLS